MAKWWFLAPHWDIVPDKYLCLGHIIRNPSDPMNTLNAAERVTNLRQPSTLIAQGTYEATLAGHGDTNLALWARLTEMVPIGAKASANFRRDDLDIFKIETVKTTIFMPTNQYLAESIAAGPQVQSALNRTVFRASLYIVTGVKIATGAKFSQSTSTDKSGQLEATADTGQGVSAGGSASAAKDYSKAVSFEQSDPFVFAFQLRKILYKKKKVFGTDAYNNGTMLGADDEEEEEEEEERKRRFMAGLDVQGLVEEDAGPGLFGLELPMSFQEAQGGDIFLWDVSQEHA
jgi:hypothetical protein